LEYFVFRFSYLNKAAARSRIDFGILRNGILPYALLLPYMLFSKDLRSGKKHLLLAVVCGVLFGLTLVWNIAIQESSATQTSLLTNLSPLCGIISYVF
jgi:drug/metabolite transporter (DMT)-like permease